MKRCLNLDWLEVYALEPFSVRLDEYYFVQKGWSVNVRHYGTRQYEEMFTLVDFDGHPFIEIRRKPYTSIDKKMFIPPNGCHIRLHNRTCYYSDAIKLMRDFLSSHGYEFKRIYRIDLALDFIRFDSGDYPDHFIKNYLTGVYTKINQCTISAHGEDTWSERQWHSLKWGQLKSDISTKLYCKTLELKQVGDKPYIRQAWFASGLIDDPIHLTAHKADGSSYVPDIWRLEYSIKSDGRKVFVMRQGGDENGHKILMANTLTAYDTPQKMLAVFAALTSHYFCFKFYRPNIRKSRCKPKQLFRFSPTDDFLILKNLATEKPKSSALEKFLIKLRKFQSETWKPELFKAAGAIIAYLEEVQQREQIADPYDTAQLKALQFMLHEAMTNKSSSITERQIKELAEKYFNNEIY